jgi:hypothetical protein
MQGALISVRVQLQQVGCNLMGCLRTEQNCLLWVVSLHEVHQLVFCHLIGVDPSQK